MIPRRLQPILWSQDVRKLDPETDKTYIIHQTLSHGSIEDIAWLLKMYTKNEILTVFTKTPYKDYTSSRFFFIKNLVLPLKRHPLNPRLYVKNIPRDLQ